MPVTRDCYNLLSDSQAHLERARVVMQCLHEMKSYRSFLEEVTKARRECPTLANVIPDRAYTFERYTRILLKESLDTLNELRDGGRLQSIFSDAENLLRDVDPIQTIARARDEVRKIDDALDLDFMDEAAELVRKLKIKITPQHDGLIELTMKGTTDDQMRRTLVDGSVRPGGVGRVSATDFFGGSSSGLVLDPEAVFVPQDCHHLSQRIASPFERLDAYGGVLAGMAKVKELAYRHARKVEEVGHGELQGSAAETIVGIILVVVGVALIVTGAVINDSRLIVLGICFVLGGIAVGVGGFTVVVRVLVHLVGAP